MKTLQHEARPARAKPALEPKTEPVAAPAEEAFTAREVDAAEQLIHLSESSSSSGAPRAGGSSVAATRSSSSSSRHSLNTPPAPAAPVPLGGCPDWEEEEEREVAGSQRRVKRYRLIAEIYAATEEYGAHGGSGSRKNKKESRTRNGEEKDLLVVSVIARG
uniref:Uncharacterized protein n=1 Tax=Avena sativa TaxID=4498 RepID=A0ACD5XZ81_AVESA